MSRRRVQRPWRVRLARLALGLALWAASGVAIYLLFLAPQPQAPTPAFLVCILDNGEPVSKTLNDARHDGDTPCREPLAIQRHNGLYRLILSRHGDTYHLREYSDSMSDPREYTYRLDAHGITPLSWQYAASLRKMIALFYAIPTAWILFRLLLWRARRKAWRWGKWLGV